MDEVLGAVIVCIIVGSIGAVAFSFLIYGPMQESTERCENLSIQKNATSFIARNFRDCELIFCEEAHSGNDTLLGKCYTEEWELEERK